jgi:hypothetical protein
MDHDDLDLYDPYAAPAPPMWHDRNEPQFPRIIFDSSWNPDIVVGCRQCRKTWPIESVPGADPEEVMAAAKDLDFGHQGCKLFRGVFVPCALNGYVCALCSGAIATEGVLSCDVYGPEKDRLGFDKTTVRWLHGAEKGPHWGIGCPVSCIGGALVSRPQPTVYEKVRAMFGESTRRWALAGYASNQGALFHADYRIQLVRVRRERDSHQTFAKALLCDGVPNCFAPIKLSSLMGNFMPGQQAAIYQMWADDPRTSERAAFAALFHMPPALGFTKSGFCKYEGTPVPALRRLTNAYGLTAVRRRLVAYLVPGAKARAVRSTIPSLIPDYYKTPPDYFVCEERILADAPDEKAEQHLAKRAKKHYL